MTLDVTSLPAPGSSEPDAAVRPYGPVGLCVSLLAILVLAAALCAAACGAAALVEILQLGWSGFMAALGAFRAQGAAARELALMLGSLLVYAGITAAVLILARWRAGAAWRSLVAWRPWRPDRRFWVLAVATICYNIAVSALLAYVYPRSENWVSVPHAFFGASLFFLLAVVFAPVTEEILFRGWIYTNLKPRLGVVVSVLIVSVIFALLHYESSHLYALAVFPVGLALAYVRERSGSLKASISFHAIFNGVAFGLAYLGTG